MYRLFMYYPWPVSAHMGCRTNKCGPTMTVFPGDIEPEASEMGGELSELVAVNSATVGGTGSMLMLEAASVPALSMDTSSGENYHLALSVPQGEVVVVSSADSEYTACHCVFVLERWNNAYMIIIELGDA
jgi:hypothetical protein